MRVGKHVYPATLLDESATGFSVVIDQPTEANVGQTVELDTEVGSFSARVIHIQKTAPTATETDSKTQGPAFRLGLLRISDIIASEPSVSVLTESFRHRLKPLNLFSGGLALAGVLLALAVALASLGLLEYHRWKNIPIVKPFIQWIDGISKSAAPSGSRRPSPPSAPMVPPAESPSPTNESTGFSDRSPFPGGKPDFRSDSDFSSTEAGAMQSVERGLSDMIRRLPGADALTLPQVVRELQLTEQQQAKITELIDATARAMQDLYDQMKGRPRQEISQAQKELRDRARTDALDLLTERQRARWKELSGE